MCRTLWAMSNEDNKHIRAWVDAGRAFDHCIQQDYPAGLMDFRPELPDAWTIREHIVHVLDADLMCHHRLRFAIAEPGFAIPYWDEEAWKDKLDYAHQNVSASISLLRMLRGLTGAMLERLDDAAWDAAWSLHPKRGRMDLDAWLELYTSHIEEHLAYVKRNETAWEAAGKPGQSCH